MVDLADVTWFNEIISFEFKTKNCKSYSYKLASYKGSTSIANVVTYLISDSEFRALKHSKILNLIFSLCLLLESYFVFIKLAASVPIKDNLANAN